MVSESNLLRSPSNCVTHDFVSAGTHAVEATTDSSVLLQNCVLANHTAGAVSLVASRLTAIGTTFAHNTASDNGAAITSSSSTVRAAARSCPCSSLMSGNLCFPKGHRASVRFQHQRGRCQRRRCVRHRQHAGLLGQHRFQGQQGKSARGHGLKSECCVCSVQALSGSAVYALAGSVTLDNGVSVHDNVAAVSGVRSFLGFTRCSPV